MGAAHGVGEIRVDMESVAAHADDVHAYVRSLPLDERARDDEMAGAELRWRFRHAPILAPRPSRARTRDPAAARETRAVPRGMTEPHTPADDAPVADAAPVTPDAPAPVAADDDDTTTPAGDTEADAIRKATSKANREAQNLRKRLKEFEDAEQARKDAALSETERLQKQLADATAIATKAQEAAQAASLRAAIAVEAGKLNIVDADAALALIDTTGIEHSDDGTVNGVTDALTALIAAKPYLVAKPGTPQLDPSNGGRQQPPALTPQQQTEQLYVGRSNASALWAALNK